MTRYISMVAAFSWFSLCGVACGTSSSGTSSTGTVTAVCDHSASTHYCLITRVAASDETQANSNCTEQGGTLSSACPNANLTGCCTLDSGEECYYPPTYTSMNAPSGCTLAGGTWSATQ